MSACVRGSRQSNLSILGFFFFFNDTATTEIYTLSLHDALPICRPPGRAGGPLRRRPPPRPRERSEEHTSELQSRSDLVCRLLLEKKNTEPAARLSPARGRYGRFGLLYTARR